MNTHFMDLPNMDFYRVYMDDGHFYEIIFTNSGWFITENTTFTADDFRNNVRHVFNSVGRR